LRLFSTSSKKNLAINEILRNAKEPCFIFHVSMNIDLPYGQTYLKVSIPDNNILGIVRTNEIVFPDGPTKLIDFALQHPLGTLQIHDIVSPSDTVAIVVDDYTRPCPTKILLPPLLQELSQAGINDTDVTIIIGTGTHHPPSIETIQKLLGEKILRNYNVIFTDQKSSSFVNVGESSYHHHIEILKEYVEADVKILVSDIEYHYFAGYGGIRKSVLPAISSKKTIQQNHAMMFDPHASTGNIKQNPVHLEMTQAMRMTGCDFSLGCVINSKHHIVGVWTGDPELVMDAGITLVDRMYKSEIPSKPDIVVVASDGAPHDINLYQALKALYTASQVVKNNGWIILAADCHEGIGSDLYQEWLQRYQTSSEIKTALEKDFQIGAHKAYYHRLAVETFHIGLVSSFPDSFVKQVLSFQPFLTLQDALDHALKQMGESAKVLVIPNGTTTHVTIPTREEKEH
jgi:nickel-dependent lactate racemase